jgi:general stress protein 26
MVDVSALGKGAFFEEVGKACAAAVWCAWATQTKNGPRVRMVHPTWEGDVLWLATGSSSPKAKQMAENPMVDIQWQVSPPNFVHILCRGKAELLMDDATRAHAWDALDYDLKGFFPGGSTDPNYVAVKVTPTRVELSQMFGSVNQRVWRA